jgi:hypothetical protein
MFTNIIPTIKTNAFTSSLTIIFYLLNIRNLFIVEYMYPFTSTKYYTMNTK